MDLKNKRKRGRPTLSENGAKSVKFTIRMPAALRRQLKPVPADEIRRALAICAGRHEHGGLLDTRESPPMHRVDRTGPQGGQDGSQGLEPQYTAPAAPQGGQEDESAAGADKTAQPDQAVDPGDLPAAQAAPPDLKTGWAAGGSRCPDTESLFTE